MQDLLSHDNWINCFKYFSFRYKAKTVQRIYYRNAIYEGQTIVSPSSSVPIKHGVGCVFTNNGEFYYGQFKDDKLHGDGNIITSKGSFFRGNFRNGKYRGVGLFVKSDNDMYILKFKDGILYSKVTYFPATSNEGFLLQYNKNKLFRVIKRYQLGSNESNKAKFKVIRSLFENSQQNEILYTAVDVQKVIKKSGDVPQKFIGSHMINNNYFYCGVFGTKLGFEGLGLVLNFTNRKVRVGDWANQLINGCGFIMEGKYRFSGNFKQNNLLGKVIVTNMANGDSKVCEYENGRFKKALPDKGEDYRIFSLEKEDDIKTVEYSNTYLAYLSEDYENGKLTDFGLDLETLDLSIKELEEFILEKQETGDMLLNFNFMKIPKKNGEKKSTISVKEYGEVDLKDNDGFIKKGKKRLTSVRKKFGKTSSSVHNNKKGDFINGLSLKKHNHDRFKLSSSKDPGIGRRDF